MFFLATAASASPQDDDDSLDTDGFREDQCLLETPTPGEDTSPRTKSEYLGDYASYSSATKEIESQEVTTYADIRQYYQHQAKLFAGHRKRLASTEDLDTDVIDASTTTTSNLLPSNLSNSELTGIVKIGLDRYKLIDSDPVRPGELRIRGYTSPEEKGAKDSKRPEDWERKERKTVERLQGGAGKDKIPPSEEKVHLKATPDKKITISYTEITNDLQPTSKISDTNIEQGSIGLFQKSKTIERPGLQNYSERGITKNYGKDGINTTQINSDITIIDKKDKSKHVHRSTSPLLNKDISPSTDNSPPTVTDTSKPTLELIIGRKEVRTKEALATAESRLTLYGTKDVEISIKSQSHISVITTRRDTSGTETSERFDVGMSTTAGRDKSSPENIQMAYVDKHGAYIIPPLTVLESTQKKKEETVNFSGTKQIYTYHDSASERVSSQMASPTSESISHHITDTGISLTRGTITGTTTSPVEQPHATLAGQQTTGFISDIAVDGEIEECECTDAGLSPIQADELPTQDLEEEITQFTDAGTSPIEFLESVSVPLSHVDTSEAATLTDHIDMKDSSCSPIKPEESTPISSSEKLRDEEILEKRRGSGDVKAKIKMLEEQVSKSPQKEHLRKKREIVESEDELSSMKEEEAFRGSTETLAQIDDEEYKMESITEQLAVSEEKQIETIDTKPKHVTPTHTKQVGRKIAELQKIFSSDMEISFDEDLTRSPIKSFKSKEKEIKDLLQQSLDDSTQQELNADDIESKEEQAISTEELKLYMPKQAIKVRFDETPDLDMKDSKIIATYENESKTEIEDGINGQYKSVKDKKSLFEQLISKSQESSPAKKST
ncbi:hypothetical protein NQ314_013876 [Rhamnusium bicolor]|uniref:Uncharacterized protein n=1 Tax=Rhamnusium bicolor TaxID=1586634 RepID=A0AAV8X4N0_9CUCU|nr:hypothetical protein NQ314_013876 [Rhamnusium bicolor]